MPRQQVTTASRPALGPYSQAIVANGFLYTAGQTPHDPVTGRTVGEHDRRTDRPDHEEPGRGPCSTRPGLLPRGEGDRAPAPPGPGLRRVQRDLRTVRRTPYPARTTVGSFLGDFLVEIDVVATIP